MTITPRHTHRRMVRFARTLDDLILALPAAVESARQRDLARMADTPKGEGGRVKGAIADPTGRIASNIVDAGTDDHEDIEQYMETIQMSLRLLAKFTHAYTDVDVFDDAHPVEHRRCGEYTPREIKLEDWYTAANQRGRTPAQCTDEALYSVADNGDIVWATHGLCAADYQAMRRAMIKAGMLDRGAEWVA